MSSIKEFLITEQYQDGNFRDFHFKVKVKTEPMYWFESDHILDIKIPLIDVYASRSYDLEGQIFRRTIESLPDEDFSPCWCPV